MRWTDTLEHRDGATLLISDTEYELKFGLLGKVMDAFVMHRKFFQIIADALGALKKYVEEKK